MAHEILRTTLLATAAIALAAGQMIYSDTAEARGAGGFARTNVNINRGFDRHVNVGRDVNVDVDRHGWGYHPIATGVAVGATAAVTAALTVAPGLAAPFGYAQRCASRVIR